MSVVEAGGPEMSDMYEVNVLVHVQSFLVGKSRAQLLPQELFTFYQLQTNQTLFQ